VDEIVSGGGVSVGALGCVGERSDADVNALDARVLFWPSLKVWARSEKVAGTMPASCKYSERLRNQAPLSAH
jgi:hypothetical protein